MLSLCITKYEQLNPLKGKTNKIVLNAFIEIVSKSNCKSNKLSVDQGRELYHKLMHEWLDNKGIYMYSIYNKGNSVIVEKHIKILKAKIYKKWQLMIINLILVI